MAVIVFSGGQTLRVPSTAQAVTTGLRDNEGLIPQDWCQFESGDSIAHINPRQIAYVVDDEAFDETFGQQE